MVFRLASAVGTAAALLFSVSWIAPTPTEDLTIAKAETSYTPDEAQARLDAAERARVLATVDDTLARWEAAIQQQAPLATAEHRALQAAPYHEHISASRQVGVRPWRAKRDLTKVRPGSPYYVTGTDGLLAPAAITTLDLIGERFQAELREAGLPMARFIVTSTHRSAAEQAALREINANATLGQSSHEFGGSFDIGYNRFLPALEGTYAPLYELHGDVPPRLLAPLSAEAAEREAAWAEQVVERNADAYDVVLGRVLIELQAEGRLIPLREYYQPCYHVTARPHREVPRA